MFQLVNRTVDVSRRSHTTKRRDNLQSGDADIPGSIVYAAVVRAAGNLGDINVLDGVLQATRDLDPYVRTQALEALKRLDPNGADERSRLTAREALTDPRDSVIRIACQLIVQYHDHDAIPALQNLMEARPDLSYLAQDALHQLRQ
jgi:HEAT repeat protein